MNKLVPKRCINIQLLQPGDIVLTSAKGLMSKIVRWASCGIVSHAMICVQHSSVIDSTFLGVHARNIQREIFGPSEQVFVLRLREPLSPEQLAAIVEFARSKVGTRYSVLEAVRSVAGIMSPRTQQLFCSRLVARAYASVGFNLVPDSDYCTPEALRLSPQLTELFNMTESVSQDDLVALEKQKNGTTKCRRHRTWCSNRCVSLDIRWKISTM